MSVRPLVSNLVKALSRPLVNSGVLFNFKPSQFTKWRTDAAAVRGGTGRATVVCGPGDSLTWGEGGGDASQRINADINCVPNRASARLTALGLASTNDDLFGTGGNTADFIPNVDLQASYKSNFTYTGGWVQSSSTSVGGMIFTNSTDLANMTITLAGQDTLELWTLTNTGLGSMTYKVDAGAPVTLNQNAAAAAVKTVIALGAPGAHTVLLNRVAGNVFVIGFRAYNSAVKAVDFINIGRGSSLAATWIVNTVAYNILPVFTTMAAPASIVIPKLTTNDAAANTAEATYKSQMQTLITAGKAGGASMMLMTGSPTNPATDPIAQQLAFRQYMKDLAITNDLPLIDLWAVDIDYATLVSRGFMFDNRHKNKAGYAAEGVLLGDILNTWSQ